MDSSFRSHTEEHLPGKTNKIQSQRQYRSKETDGFSELRSALQTVDPFGAPLGRDATRYQILLKAANQLRHLASENVKLRRQLSVTNSTDSLRLESAIPIGIQSGDAMNLETYGHAWPTATEKVTTQPMVPAYLDLDSWPYVQGPSPGLMHQTCDIFVESLYQTSSADFLAAPKTLYADGVNWLN
ncbi:hypothetical protein HYDPIDRAFT_111979 [Hydnomerulius pinastri MD-312]|uniref:BHLH domain-containing protein n=1 Tax=Hydnomerulius pinastri MD-312 TaxID=994086 RepID=A0A0C9W9U8_9AGAM|nr:hypothetical protein HYDPIDRAFT_111979 [Hydnomerulius pinastri MD-312]